MRVLDELLRSLEVLKLKLAQLPAFKDAVAALRKKREVEAAWARHDGRRHSVVLSNKCEEKPSEVKQGRSA